MCLPVSEGVGWAQVVESYSWASVHAGFSPMLRVLWEVSGFQDSTVTTKGDFSRASLLEGRSSQNGTSVQKVGHSQLGCRRTCRLWNSQQVPLALWVSVTKLYARLQRMSIACGNGGCYCHSFLATWTAILADLNFAEPDFHKGGGHVGERDSDLVLRWLRFTSAEPIFLGGWEGDLY